MNEPQKRYTVRPRYKIGYQVVDGSTVVATLQDRNDAFAQVLKLGDGSSWIGSAP